MWRTRRSILTAASFLAIAGCSTFMPYESDFACKSTDYGKCIHPEEAYREATADSGETSGVRQTSASKRADKHGPVIEPSATGYEGYRQAVYSELATLIEAPTTPMLAPAKTIRTLILPYADEKREQWLYMPRYVYSVLEAPRFVLGDYLAAPSNDFAGALAEGLLISPESPAAPPQELPHAPMDDSPSGKPIALKGGSKP